MIISGYIHKRNETWDNDLYITKEKGVVKYEERLTIQLASFDKKFVMVRYAMSDVPFDNVEEKMFMSYFGKYDDNSEYFRVSEVSVGTLHNCIIGKHNLTNELIDYEGLYVVLEIEEVDRPKWIKK